jgi:hypothetical protein
MSHEYLGSLTLGACVPTALTASGQLILALNLALPQLQAKLAGLLKISMALTIKIPSLDALIAALTNVVVQITALLNSPPPSIGLSLSVVAALIAQIQLDLGGIQGQLALALALQLVLGTPGIEAYKYEGIAGNFTSEMASEFTSGLRIGGGPYLPIYAITLVATDGGAIAAMQKVLVS